MSKYEIGEFDGFGFQLVKRKGRVEMWHNPKTDSHTIVLYENEKRDERQLLHKSLKNKEKADEVFDIVAELMK
jgi:hypothetical protein